MALLGTSLNREYNSFGHLSFRGRYFSFLLATVHFVAVAFRFFWPRVISWPLLFVSFGHGSSRGRYFSFLLATVHFVAVTFRFFWPPFISWPLLFVSFGHRSICGRYFSFLLATVHFVAVSFQFRLICTIRIFYCIKKPPVWLGLAEKGVNYSLKRE